jgi:hypothetical protein
MVATGLRVVGGVALLVFGMIVFMERRKRIKRLKLTAITKRGESGCVHCLSSAFLFPLPTPFLTPLPVPIYQYICFLFSSAPFIRSRRTHWSRCC